MITEGIPAIRRLIGQGSSVNITLLPSTKVHENMVDAYLFGVEDRLVDGGGRSASPARAPPMPLHQARHQ
ncbi:hypothetical protein E3T34_14510 [Cryobacterium sp. TMT1-62]|nr:hypothetical protein E3O54_02775 [Cryobacterium sp. TMT2-4]TFD30166.1 hypothetical protein E3T34_14510 [Cryobacterium sp. TMT1-62]